MSAYPDEPPRRYREHRPRPRDYDQDEDDEPYYRPQRSRDHRYDEPTSHGRSRRHETYDASDEDDEEYPRRRQQRHERPSQRPEEPTIPPPPIGEDRKTSRRGGSGGDHAERTSPGGEGDREDALPIRRKSQKDSVSPAKDRDPYEDAGLSRDPRKSSRRKGDEHGYNDEDEVPRYSKGRDRDRERYDDPEPPRRSKRDPYDDLRRSKPSRREEDPRRRRAQYDEDTEPEYERPRRREKPSRYDEGYGTDRPRRSARDDYYQDKGYRTDGRDSKRDRYRDDDRYRRDDRRRPEYYDDGARKSKKAGAGRGRPDFNEMLEKGQKNWKRVEPFAKPLLAQVAKKYL